MYEEDEEGLKPTAEGKPQKKKSQRKTIYDVYEPSELERGHFTDYDEQVISFVLFFLAITPPLGSSSLTFQKYYYCNVIFSNFDIEFLYKTILCSS